MRTWKKSRSGMKGFLAFSETDCEHCFDLVILYCGCTFGMAEKSTGFVLWTIYLVLCGFGYAGYVFYLAATGAYEIVELEKIEMTRQLDKVYRLDHAVTKTQKVILSAFDMDWNYVKYRAENISRILKGVQ